MRSVELVVTSKCFSIEGASVATGTAVFPEGSLIRHQVFDSSFTQKCIGGVGRRVWWASPLWQASCYPHSPCGGLAASSWKGE